MRFRRGLRMISGRPCWEKRAREAQDSETRQKSEPSKIQSSTDYSPRQEASSGTMERRIGIPRYSSANTTAKHQLSFSGCIRRCCSCFFCFCLLAPPSPALRRARREATYAMVKTIRDREPVGPARSSDGFTLRSGTSGGTSVSISNLLEAVWWIDVQPRHSGRRCKTPPKQAL